MLSKEETERYQRHLVLSEIGMQGQLKLKHAKVLIIGMGGLGCPLAQYLAAAGVGTLGMVDFDTVSLSNLQRQVLFTSADVGRMKVEVAKEKVLALNPNVQVQVYPEKCNPGRILQMMKDYDIIADCTDNYAARYLINDACVTLEKPFVSASVFKFEYQLSVYNYNGGPTYRCLFPEPPEEALNCAEAGVLGVLTGIAGAMQANEIVKIIVGTGEVLSGKVLVYNALNNQSLLLSLHKDASAVQKIKDLKGDLSSHLIDFNCTLVPPVGTIEAAELKNLLDAGSACHLIDVREEYEQEYGSLGGDCIPLGDLEKNLERIPMDVPVVLYCTTGRRSAEALGLLLKLKPFQNILHLSGGLNAWDNLMLESN
jgi:molybdopterin/thiamine biosynthesis adenylyltransferase/rhodanese-related sulfurtransferase